MKKISYSKYKKGISYNEENKLFKVQKVCVPNFTQVKLFTLQTLLPVFTNKCSFYPSSRGKSSGKLKYF